MIVVVIPNDNRRYNYNDNANNDRHRRRYRMILGSIFFDDSILEIRFIVRSSFIIFNLNFQFAKDMILFHSLKLEKSFQFRYGATYSTMRGLVVKQYS